MESYATALLRWMEANDKLAGWAQFGGAMLALLIAIWVPWYQARVSERTARAERLDRSLASLQGVYYLLVDIAIWLKGVGDRGHMPRREFRDPVEVNDLLERLKIWESRDDDFERVTALFRARGAVARTHQSLSLGFLQSAPVTKEERGRIQQYVDAVRADIELIDKQRERVHRARLMNKVVWFMKPVVVILWPILFRWFERRSAEKEEAAD